MGSINVFPFSCLTFLMGDKKTELIKKAQIAHIPRKNTI